MTHSHERMTRERVGSIHLNATESQRNILSQNARKGFMEEATVKLSYKKNKGKKQNEQNQRSNEYGKTAKCERQAGIPVGEEWEVKLTGWNEALKARLKHTNSIQLAKGPLWVPSREADMMQPAC